MIRPAVVDICDMLASQLLSPKPQCPIGKSTEMRVIASLLTLIFLAAALWLGQGVWQQLRQPAPALQLARVQPMTPTSQPGVDQPPRRWPMLFGTLKVEEPQPPAPVELSVAEPRPPAPPQPPIESLGYRLKGVVRNGTADWAIVTHPTGDMILQLGDHLGEAGPEVVEIAPEGLWLLRGGERQFLGFETQVP